MTWPPERLGDKGQRYMLEAEGYPKPGWQPIAYGNDLMGMELAKDGILLAPGCTAAKITDRFPDAEKQKPYKFLHDRWKRCPSTHCERAEECRSPNECSAAAPKFGS